MKTIITFALTTVFIILNAQNMQPPKAKKIEKKLEKFGDVRIDNYYWLNDRENPEVIDYLKAENAYTEAQLKDTENFQQILFEEIKSRIKEDDASVPYKLNGYWYISKFRKGGEYPIYSRKKESLEAAEEIMFDVNEMAKPYSFYNLSGISVSENNEIAAFGEDTLSRRIYTIRFKDLKTGKIIADELQNTTGRSVWAADNKTVFYTRKDNTLRAYQIWKHILGTPQNQDQLIFEEKDETFNAYVYKSKSRQYIIIGSASTLSDEYRFIPANKPDAAFQIFQKKGKRT